MKTKKCVSKIFTIKQLKSLALIALSLNSISMFSQGNGNGPRWSPSGNTATTGDFLGTTNPFPLPIKTNNVTRFTFDTNGDIFFNSLANGTSNRVMTLDASGKLSALSGTSLGNLFNSNGIGVMQTSGNDYYLPTGNLGIGIAPSPAFKLDVIGDMRVSNNLYIGNGILITNQVQAANQIKGLDVKIDNSLNVTGVSTFTGNITNLTLAGTGISKVYSNANGTLFKGPSVPASWECVGGSPNWNVGGNNYNSQAFIGVTSPDIGTCDDADFILKSNSNPKIWLKNSSGAENIGFGTPNPLSKFQFSGGNLTVDDKIGIGTTNPNTKLEVVDPTNAQVCIYSTSNNAAKMFVKNALYSYGLSIDGNTQTNSQINGHIVGNVNVNPNEAIITWDGNGNILLGDKTLNTQVNTGAKLNVKGEVNKAVANFVSNHNGPFAYNTLLTVNNNFTKAFAIQNTSGGPAIESFRVYGNGQTQIGIKSQNTIHSDALLNVFGKMVSTACYIRTTDWADYVFANGYKVPNLYDVEKYYLENKHLPEIPSEKEVMENGIDVAEINKLLLKKIEEMTILMVKQQKQIDALEGKIK